MVQEYQEEGEETEDIEFGMIKALSERARSERIRGHWTIPNNGDVNMVTGAYKNFA